MLLVKDKQAEIAQLVEHNLAKVGVAGPSPVFRSQVEQVEVKSGLSLQAEPRWRNWETRTFQVRVPRGVQVRVLFWARFVFYVGEVAELVDALL